LDGLLTHHRKANPLFRDAPLELINDDLHSALVNQLPMLWGDVHAMTARRPPHGTEDDGVHSVWSAARTAAIVADFLTCLFPKEPVDVQADIANIAAKDAATAAAMPAAAPAAPALQHDAPATQAAAELAPPAVRRR
jgi:hypothetical protein